MTMPTTVADSPARKRKSRRKVRYTGEIPMKRTNRKITMRNTITGWSFILPNFIGFAVITLVPVLTMFYMSFTDWNIFGDSNWVGIENYQWMVGNSGFRTALNNTLFYSVIHIPVTLAAALGLALLLNRKMRGIAFFRTVAFFPFITSIVAIAAVWNMLFSPTAGPINQFLGGVGVDNPPGWTTSADWSMWAILIVQTWRFMGYYMLLFLAGLQTVPRELHEAAYVDGASAWHRFWHVTMPCLRPVTFFVTVMCTINALRVFDLVLVMTDGGPGRSTLVLSQLIWQRGFDHHQFGRAAAIAVALFALSMSVTIFQFVVNKRRER